MSPRVLCRMLLPESVDQALAASQELMDVLTGPVMERHADPAFNKMAAPPAGPQEEAGPAAAIVTTTAAARAGGGAAAGGHEGLPGITCCNPRIIAKTPDSA